jgi:hypothetical protein
MASLAHPVRNQRLDQFAIGLSGLCLLHCIGTTVLVAVLASAGGILGSPVVHEVGLTVAMLIGAVSLGRGIVEHQFMLPSTIGALGLGVMAGALARPDGSAEAIYTVLGVMLLALGHRLNGIAAE